MLKTVDASPATMGVLAGRLYDLHADLGRFTTEPILCGDATFYDSVFRGPEAEQNHDLEQLIDRSLTGANDVIAHFHPTRQQPQHQLTDLAVRAARNRKKTPELHKNSSSLCLAAELMVQHTIKLNQTGSGPSNDKPSAVVFDGDGLPFAFSKSYGKTAALAWREASFNTLSGKTIVPCGAFFSFRFGNDGKTDVQDAVSAQGRHVLSLEEVGPPTSVRLIRFSTILIQSQLAELAYRNATGVGVYDELRDYVPVVRDLGLEGVASQVHELLESGRPYVVKPRQVECSE